MYVNELAIRIGSFIMIFDYCISNIYFPLYVCLPAAISDDRGFTNIVTAIKEQIYSHSY